MAENLIQETKKLFTNTVVEQMSRNLQESPAAISKALNAILPSLFAGFLYESSLPVKEKELNDFVRVAGTQSNQELMALYSASGEGSKFVHELFEKIGGTGFTNVIANFATIKPVSARTLLQMTLPVVMGFLGRYFATKQNENAFETLQQQKDFLEKEMPVGLNLAVITGASSVIQTEKQEEKTKKENSQAEEFEDTKANGLKWFFPVLLLAILGAAALYFTKQAKLRDAELNSLQLSDTNLVMPDSVELADDISSARGTVDAAGNFNYDNGPIKTFDLNGISFQAGAKSSEIDISEYLMEKDPGNKKGKWFTLKNVQFDPDSNTITNASLPHLSNIAKIVQAFPGIKLHVSSFTDSSGNMERDMVASKERARKLVLKFQELGIPDSTIRSAEGYGYEFPLGGKKSAETSAKNRRIVLYIVPGGS